MKKEVSLKALRQARNMTLMEVAKILNVSTGYVCHLETGIRKLNDDLATRIAKILDYPEDEVRKAGQLAEEYNALNNNWISQMRINGYPVFEAFKYHLQAKKKRLDVRSKTRLKNQLAKFINDNLPYSVMAELSENDILLDQVVEHCKK